MGLFRHAGPEEPAPYAIRGHPEVLEKTGFRLEFIPMKIGAGMTTFLETVYLWIDSNSVAVSSHAPHELQRAWLGLWFRGLIARLCFHSVLATRKTISTIQ